MTNKKRVLPDETNCRLGKGNETSEYGRYRRESLRK